MDWQPSRCRFSASGPPYPRWLTWGCPGPSTNNLVRVALGIFLLFALWAEGDPKPRHRCDNKQVPALQRQNTEISKQIFPEKEYRGLSPNFQIHASVSDLYITMIGLPILLEEICRPILGLYKSLTDTWMLKLGLRPRYSQLRNT